MLCRLTATRLRRPSESAADRKVGTAAIARLKVDIEMSQPTVDHQSARRRTAMWMFIVLVLGVLGLVIALIFAVPALPDSEFVRGIVLTAIAGAISAFLSFIGIIVKGLVDNLTREE